jgi:hypothetical protein
MKMHVFAMLDRAKHDIENIRSVNYVAVKRTTVQVTSLPLYPELTYHRARSTVLSLY